jgi:nitroreductase
MNPLGGPDNAAAVAALAAAARTAGFAPSIHNTQPWQWRVIGTTMELRAERSRQLSVTDPSGRMLTISCGAALHHAKVALAAEAWHATVVEVPDPADGDLLASIEITGRTDVDLQSVRDLQTLRIRQTDRRPVADTPLGQADITALTEVATTAGARLHFLRHDDIIELASAADRAQHVESLDPAWREEVAFWAGAAAQGGLGVPAEVIPARPPETTVPGRNFGQPGTLSVGAGHDTAARYAVLYGDDDTPPGWLRGGEALSATWLRAIQRGLTLLPLSATIEVLATRQLLRHLLAELGEPYLVLRIGAGHDDASGPRHTPRLPSEQTVEIVAG